MRRKKDAKDGVITWRTPPDVSRFMREDLTSYSDDTSGLAPQNLGREEAEEGDEEYEMEGDEDTFMSDEEFDKLMKEMNKWSDEVADKP